MGHINLWVELGRNFLASQQFDLQIIDNAEMVPTPFVMFFMLRALKTAGLPFIFSIDQTHKSEGHWKP